MAVVAADHAEECDKSAPLRLVTNGEDSVEDQAMSSTWVVELPPTEADRTLAAVRKTAAPGPAPGPWLPPAPTVCPTWTLARGRRRAEHEHEEWRYVEVTS